MITELLTRPRFLIFRKKRSEMDDEARIRFFDQLLSRLRSIAGVRHAAISSGAPGMGSMDQHIELEQFPIAIPAERPWVSVVVQSPGIWIRFICSPERRMVAATLVSARVWKGLPDVCAFRDADGFVGIYAVIAQASGSRTQEIGVRLALGATLGNTLFLVMRRGLWQISCGLALGLEGAFPLVHLMASLPEGLRSDPSIIFAVAITLALVGTFACWLPARRATGLEPLQVIRYE